MSYVALYRKWRPRTFDEVRGQDAVCTALKHQVESGRVGHAYLFCGTRGTGKTSVAKILARAVNCEHPENGNPCGVCPACQAILKDSSMNVTEIDAASNNGVDNIRDIRDQVQYSPTEGKYRVFIIDEVHMLSTGAFNALLKTLEEPPSYCIFILATTEVHKVPVTVLSRCQRYDFRRIPASVIADRLKELCGAEGISAEDRALSYIARAADGALRDALSLLDECVAFLPEGTLRYEDVLGILGAVDAAAFSSLFRAVSGGRVGEALAALGSAFEEGRDLGQFIGDFLWYLRNLLILKTAENAAGMIDSTGEQLELMRQDAAVATREQLMRWIRVLGELSNRLRFATQKRVMTELALIRLATPEMDDSNDALAERVASLERELRDLKASGIPMARAGADAGMPGVVPGGAQGAAGMAGTAGNSGMPGGLYPGGAAGQAGSGAGQIQGETVIALPRGEYEDFMKVREDWGKLTEDLGGIYTAAFRGTQVEPSGEGAMCVVFPSAGMQRFGGLEKGLERLQELVRERYQKEIRFTTRIRKGDREPARRYTVTREELETEINFPIQIEGEDGGPDGE